MITRVTIQDSVIDKPRDEKIQGVEVKIMLSPFDVPQAAFCEIDETTNALRLKFDYIARSEPVYSVTTDDALVKLTLGKASNRVYEIEVDEQAYKQGDEIQINIIKNAKKSLKWFAENNPDKKSGSFGAVKSVLEKYGEQLLPPAEKILQGCQVSQA